MQRLVDIGDRVKKGQLLAVIAAPDLDQQVVQARAQVSQAEAALKQARPTWCRAELMRLWPE